MLRWQQRIVREAGVVNVNEAIRDGEETHSQCETGLPRVPEPGLLPSHSTSICVVDGWTEVSGVVVPSGRGRPADRGVPTSMRASEPLNAPASPVSDTMLGGGEEWLWRRTDTQ